MSHPMIPKLDSQNAMVHWVTGMVANARQARPDEIDPEKPFVELGLDSMSAVSLSGDMEMLLGVDLPPTLLWEHPTISALVSHVWPLWQAKEITATAV